MRTYQIFKLEPEGEIAGPCLVIRCPSDEAAVAAALHAFGEEHDLEIFRDDVFVATIPALA